MSLQRNSVLSCLTGTKMLPRNCKSLKSNMTEEWFLERLSVSCNRIWLDRSGQTKTVKNVSFKLKDQSNKIVSNKLLRQVSIKIFWIPTRENLRFAVCYYRAFCFVFNTDKNWRSVLGPCETTIFCKKSSITDV